MYGFPGKAPADHLGGPHNHLRSTPSRWGTDGDGEGSVDYEVFSASAGPALISAGTLEPFPALLEAAPDATVSVDGTGRIRLINAQTEAMFGYRRDELAGREVEVLLPARFHGRHRRHRRQYTADAQVRPMIGNGL